jgi:mannose-6-phosphate isomerase-like protein (cupin superfamily)
MHIPLKYFLDKLPLPATEKWPEGVWSVDTVSHGTMRTIVFAPRGTDHQTAHEQDELYFAVKGHGVLTIEDRRYAFKTGDALFVPARRPHRFVDFSDDLTLWAVFYGPEGGER